VLLFWSAPAGAEPLRDRILQDVDVRDRCIVAGFAFPIQYVRHFPATTGDELRIRIRPTIAGRLDGNALGGREAVRPPRRRSLHLSEVVYEGDVADGPYLVMRFDRRVMFRVGIGHDFRSVVVLVTENGSDASCFPK